MLYLTDNGTEQAVHEHFNENNVGGVGSFGSTDGIVYRGWPAGTIVLSKDDEIDYCWYEDYVAADWTGWITEGVIAVPSHHMPDHRARMIPLSGVTDTAGTAGAYTEMEWGPTGNIPELNDYNSVPVWDNNGNYTTVGINWAFTPGNSSNGKFTGATYYNDATIKYATNDSGRFGLSPYLYDGTLDLHFRSGFTNTAYTNAFSDVFGIKNTNILYGISSSFSAATACHNFTNGNNGGMFTTPGTWYLPAMGELIYIVPRLTQINSALEVVAGIKLPVSQNDVYFWSSTEIDDEYARYLNLTYGYASGFDRRDKTECVVLPFAKVKAEVNWSQRYLTFVAREPGTFKFSGSSASNTLQYSLDNGNTWTTLAHDTNSPTVAADEKILWKASGLTINSSNGIGKFVSSNRFEAEGNVMSLLYGDDFKGQTNLEGKASAFTKLFSTTTGITTAENLILPATTLSDRCYRYMFEGCTSLATAPELPATTLTQYCYDSMFYGCTSLTTAPVLPATTLADRCYQYMFYGCTNLRTAPLLPATTLAVGCYYDMFKRCFGLRTAPELPATALTDWCYYGMFDECYYMTTAPELPATALAVGCYNYMFSYCYSITTAPELPATALTNSCYGLMFAGCVRLTTAPELPATTLTQYCYDGMFSGCTSLNYVKCLAETGINTNSSTADWLSNVSSTGTFVKASGVTWPSGINGIPSGWTVQDA